MSRDFKPCRYRIAEMNDGTLFPMGHLTTAVPSDAVSFTIATPAGPEAPVQEAHIMVFRKRRQITDLAANDDEIAFLGVGDRATVIGHPAFEPIEGL